MSGDHADEFNRLIVRIGEAEADGLAIDRYAVIAKHPRLAVLLDQYFSGQRNVGEPFEPSDEIAITLPLNDTPPDQYGGVTCGDLDAANPELRVPCVRRFGDYVLQDEIARGGMGVVFKARQVKLNRTVALKMILSGKFAGDQDIKRFQREAEAAARLDHPGIVPIFEIGVHAGQHYFSMAYVDGKSLARQLADGPLPHRHAASLMLGICDAVAHAHDHGVIHRDLKPSNILVDAQGQPRVTDFGLAKRVEADGELTQTGQLLGTPAYMPPEQASGKADEIGPHSDIYALGAVFYHLLTGRPPFEADHAADIIRQVRDQEPVAPRRLNASIPVDYETVVLKCLEKKPGLRYDGVRDLKAEAERCLAGEPVRARPITRPERLVRWMNRNRVYTGLLFLVAFLFISVASSTAIGFIATNRALRRVRAQNAVTLQQKQEISEQKEMVKTQRDQLSHSLYNIGFANAMKYSRGGNHSALRETVSKLESLVLPDLDPRGPEWQYLANLRESSLGKLPSGNSQPRGKSSTSELSEEHHFWFDEFACSHQDAASDYGKLVGNPFVSRLRIDPDWLIADHSFSPAGDTVDLIIYRKRQPSPQDFHPGMLVNGLIDGAKLLRLKFPGGQHLSEREIAIPPNPNKKATATSSVQFRFAARGKIVVVESSYTLPLASRTQPDLDDLSDDVRLIDSETGVELLRRQSHGWKQSRGRIRTAIVGWQIAAISNDGQRVAIRTPSWHEPANAIEIVDVTTSNVVRKLTEHQFARTRTGSFTNDGRYFGAADNGRVYVWDLEDGGKHFSYEGNQLPIRKLCVDRGGARIACLGQNNMIDVRNFFTGELLTTVDGGESIVTQIAFGPMDWSLALSTHDGDIIIKDSWRTQNLRDVWLDPSFVPIAFSPDDRFLFLMQSKQAIFPHEYLSDGSGDLTFIVYDCERRHIASRLVAEMRPRLDRPTPVQVSISARSDLVAACVRDELLLFRLGEAALIRRKSASEMLGLNSADLEDGTGDQQAPRHALSSIRCVGADFTEDGKSLVVTLRLLDSNRGRGGELRVVHIDLDEDTSTPIALPKRLMGDSFARVAGLQNGVAPRFANWEEERSIDLQVEMNIDRPLTVLIPQFGSFAISANRGKIAFQRRRQLYISDDRSNSATELPLGRGDSGLMTTSHIAHRYRIGFLGQRRLGIHVPPLRGNQRFPGDLHVYDAKTGDELLEYVHRDLRSPECAVRFSPGGSWIATKRYDDWCHLIPFGVQQSTPYSPLLSDGFLNYLYSCGLNRSQVDDYLWERWPKFRAQLDDSPPAATTHNAVALPDRFTLANDEGFQRAIHCVLDPERPRSEFKDALAYAETLAKKSSPNLRVSMLLGAAYYRCGKFQRCYETLMPVQRMYPNFGVNLQFLGLAAYRLKHQQQLQAILERMEASRDAEVRFGYAQYLTELGDDDGARKIYHALMEEMRDKRVVLGSQMYHYPLWRQVNLITVSKTLAKLEARSERPVEAAAIWRFLADQLAASAADPERAVLQCERGVALYHCGEYAQALQLLKPLAQLSVRMRYTMRKYAACYLAMSAHMLGESELAKQTLASFKDRRVRRIPDAVAADWQAARLLVLGNERHNAGG